MATKPIKFLELHYTMIQFLIRAIIKPYLTNMASVRIIFWVIFNNFLFSFLYIGGVFNKTIIILLLLLVGYEMIIAHSVLCVSGWLFTIPYPTCAHGIIN